MAEACTALCIRLVAKIEEIAKVVKFHKMQSRELLEQAQLAESHLKRLQQPGADLEAQVQTIEALRSSLEKTSKVVKECGRGRLYCALNHVGTKERIEEAWKGLGDSLHDLGVVSQLERHLPGTNDKEDLSFGGLELAYRKGRLDQQAFVDTLLDSEGISQKELEECQLELIDLQRHLQQSSQQVQDTQRQKHGQEELRLEQIIAHLSSLCPPPQEASSFAIPPSYLCNICLHPMLDPVSTAFGHAYDRACIQRWFQSGRRTNPSDGRVLQSTEVVDNVALRQLVEFQLRDLEPFRSSPRENWDHLIRRCYWEERTASSSKSVVVVEEVDGAMGMRRPKCAGASIEDLPDQILLDIFAIVHPGAGEGKQLLQYTEVCKHWRELVPPMVKSLTVPPWVSPQLALKLINKLPNLRSLTLEGTRCPFPNLSALFVTLGRDCQQLRELNLIKVVELKPEAVDTLFCSMTMLQALVIKFCRDPITLAFGYRLELGLLFLWRLASLERLHIEDCCCGRPGIAVEKLASLRTLIMRNVAGACYLYDVISVSNLETLEFRPNPYFVKGAIGLPSLAGLSNLQTLEATHLTTRTMGRLRLEGLANLQTLTLSLEHSRLQTLLGLEGLTNLRSLDLRSSILEQSDDITTLPFLENLKITVDGSQPPITLSQLTTLRQLSICGGDLPVGTELPALDNLSLLTWLDISTFSRFGNGQEELQKLSHLSDLRARLSDDAYSFLPLRLQSAAVTELELTCDGIRHTRLHRALRLLPNLSNLLLVGNSVTPLPLLGGPYPRLQNLGLSNFQTGNVSLHESFPALTSLSLEELKDVTVQSLAGASNLQSLKRHECSFPSLPPLMMLHSLRSLELDKCSSIVEIPSLWGLSALEELNVSDCEDLLAVVGLSGLSSLRKLVLLRLRKLAFMSPLTGLLQLQVLEICDCPMLTLVPDLSSLTSLRMLEIRACPRLEHNPPLTGLSRLLYAKLQWSPLNRDGTHPDLLLVSV